MGRISRQVAPGILNEMLGLHHKSWAAREAPSLVEGKLFGMAQADRIGEAPVGLRIVGLCTEEHRSAPRKTQPGMPNVRGDHVRTHCSRHLYREVYALASFFDHKELWWKIGEPWKVEEMAN